MAGHVSVQVQPSTFAAAEALAAEKHSDVNSVLDNAVQLGLDMLRQELFFEERLRRAGSVSVEEAFAILDRAGGDNPPDPGDEIPEDISHLYLRRVPRS